MGEKELIIVGSGPAAWTAALYAARAELKPLVYTGVKKGGQRGGQLTTTTEVENFPGFPLGVTGPELVRLMEEQARRFGIEVYEEDVVDLEIGEGGFIVKGTVNSMRSSAVILATGAYAKKIAIPGSDALWNRGISACAVCDGALPIFRNKELAVIGGGDSACEEALFLSKYASKVYLIVRRNVFRASKIMEERVRKHEKIEILFESTVEYAYGENALEHIEVKCKDDMRKQSRCIRSLCL